MKVEKSIEIATPPEKIWPFLVEPEKILKWSTTFRKFEYTSEQHSGAGTTIYLEEKAGPMLLLKVNATVTEWVENQILAARITALGNSLRGEARHILETIPSGSRYHYTENVELPFSILGKLIGVIGRRSSETALGKRLLKLKSLVEA